jgi:propionyl-CoA carboxylase alpha chain
VQEGQEIKAGQDLVVIEAMKMENTIKAEYDTKIGKIKFTDGETVGIGQIILDFIN